MKVQQKQQLLCVFANEVAAADLTAVALNSCSVYTRMTAGQLPGNWFELANNGCCYAMTCWVHCWHAVTADTVPVFVRAIDHKCI